MADKESLASFYGQGFQENVLSRNPQVEKIAKADVFKGLARATRNTQKGKYDKGSHSFEILATLCPDRVEAASPAAKRFLDTLRTEGPE